MPADPEAFHLLLAELESCRLEVMLVPLNPRLRGYNEGGCKRVCVGLNPKWYRDFCARHPSSRGIRRGKFDTIIRRANVLALLTRLAASRPTKSRYAGELSRLAEKFFLAARKTEAQTVRLGCEPIPR